MLIIQKVFLINFKVYTHKNVQVLQVLNNDNVYKFINTAKKTAVLWFLWILSFSLHFLLKRRSSWGMGSWKKLISILFCRKN